MDDDFHIISAVDDEKKSKSPIFVYIPVIVLLLMAGIVVRNVQLLKNQAVEGARTEVKDESIKFDTPESSVETQSPDQSITPNSSSKSTGTPNATKTIILKSVSAEDGFVGATGIVGINTAIRIGDDATDVLRGFVSFQLDNVPQGTVVNKATLRLYQTKVVGNAFGVHGSVTMDHVVYGSLLSSDTYSLQSEKDKIATIPQSTSSGWKEIDVTKELKNDLENARARSQYRIHFTNEKTPENNEEDAIYFESASNSELSGETPQLVVTY